MITKTGTWLTGDAKSGTLRTPFIVKSPKSFELNPKHPEALEGLRIYLDYIDGLFEPDELTFSIYALKKFYNQEKARRDSSSG